jgi:hypothetical protein
VVTRKLHAKYMLLLLSDLPMFEQATKEDVGVDLAETAK